MLNNRFGVIVAVSLACWYVGARAQENSASTETSALGPMVVYHLRAGDTLIGLARRLLIRESLWHDLEQLNDLHRTRELQPNGTMRIPVQWIRWSDATGVVIAVSGEVSLNGAPLIVGGTVGLGDALNTSATGSAAIRLSDGSEINIPPGTSVAIKAMRAAPVTDAPDIQLDLSRGSAEVSARKHRDVGRFEIRSPTAVTAVRGTEYRSHYDESTQIATAETLEGTVQVANAGGSGLPVAAGYGTQVQSGQPPLAPVHLLPAPDLGAIAGTNSSPQLAVRVVPIQGARSYRVQLSSVETFNVLDLDTVSTQPSLEIPVVSDGTHWLRVRARDEFGIEGIDSAKAFEQHTVSPVPEPALPADHAPVEGPVVFEWSYVGAGAHFRVSVNAESGTGSTAEQVFDVDSSRLTVPNLGPGSYRWKVQASTTPGSISAWSAERRINVLPAPPHIEPIIKQGHVIEVHWTPVPGYVAEVEVAHDRIFHKLLALSLADRTQVTFNKPHLGRYFVRARWMNSDGQRGAYGPAQSFVVWPPAWTLVLVPVAVFIPAL